MKHAAFILLITSGLFFSFNVLRGEKKKLKDLALAAYIAERMCVDIENYKTPLSHIIEGLRNEKSNDCALSEVTPDVLPELFDRLCEDGGKAKELTLSLMEKYYDGAVTAAKKLSAYVNELYVGKQNEYELKKTARTVLPAAIGLLAGILII